MDLTTILVLLGTLGLVAVANASADDAEQSDGGFPRDETRGGAGDDDLFSTSGNDVLRGYEGDDAIGSWNGSDTVYGGAGEDILLGIEALDDDGSDFLYGGSGDDFLMGDSGDVLTGGEGADVFHLGVFPENQPGMMAALGSLVFTFDFLEEEQLAQSRILDFNAQEDTLILSLDTSRTFASELFIEIGAFGDGDHTRVGLRENPLSGTRWLAIVNNTSIDELEAARDQGRIFGYV